MQQTANERVSAGQPDEQCMKVSAREWLKLISWAAERGIEEVNRVKGDALVRVSLRQIRDIANRRLAQVIDLEVPEAPGADRIAYDADQALEGHTEGDQ